MMLRNRSMKKDKKKYIYIYITRRGVYQVCIEFRENRIHRSKVSRKSFTMVTSDVRKGARYPGMHLTPKTLLVAL